MLSNLIRHFLPLSVLLQAYCVLAYEEPLITTLWTFPNGTWVENLQVLNNGSLLISTISHPYIWRLDLTDAGQGSSGPQVAYEFDNTTSNLGMAQIAPNIIAVAAGSLDPATLKAVPGSWSVDILDFSPLQASGPTLLARHKLPDAGFLNGMTTLPEAPGYLLLADSDLGCIWHLNLYTGVATSYKDDLFGKAPNTTSSALNGIQVAQGTTAMQRYAQSVWGRQSAGSDLAANRNVNSEGSTYLYFTNSNTDIFGRMAITRDGLPLTSETKAEQLAIPPEKTSYDDFTLTPDGSFALIADWIGTSILAYDTTTGVQGVAAGQFGDVQHLDHPTTVRWANDEYSAVYVSTAGWFPHFGGSGGGQVLKVSIKP